MSSCSLSPCLTAEWERPASETITGSTALTRLHMPSQSSYLPRMWRSITCFRLTPKKRCKHSINGSSTERPLDRTHWRMEMILARIEVVDTPLVHDAIELASNCSQSHISSTIQCALGFLVSLLRKGRSLLRIL